MRDETRWWLGTGEGDLDGARTLLGGGQYNLAAFHGQQAAEKALKALGLEVLGTFRRGHSCTALIGLLSQGEIAIPEAVDRAARHLDLHYIQSRYPNGFGADPTEHYDAGLAEECIEYAEVVLDFVRTELQRAQHEENDG